MRKIQVLTMLLFMTAFSTSVFAQTNGNTAGSDSKTAVYKVKVFFHCANGKALIEKEMVKQRGILKVSADLETKIVTVEYDKTVIAETKTIVDYFHNIGYLTADSPKDMQINKACSHGDGEHNE